MKNASFTDVNLGLSSGKRSGMSAINHSPAERPNRRSNYYHHIPVIVRVISKVKAQMIVRGVKSALREVDLIEKGIKKPQSLDQLLNEL